MLSSVQVCLERPFDMEGSMVTVSGVLFTSTKSFCMTGVTKKRINSKISILLLLASYTNTWIFSGFHPRNCSDSMV